MKSYYAALARIRYYGEIPESVRIAKDTANAERLYASREAQAADPAKWKEPPHFALVNLLLDKHTGLLDLKSVEKFTRTYGLLVGHGQPIDHVQIQGLQELLQRAWRGEPGEIEKGDIAAETEFSPTRDGVEIQVSDLWTLIRILFLCDYAAGRARVCAIADCPRTPYFLQARKGQRFCSHECAVLDNVRRFREARRKARKEPRIIKSKRRSKR
jgi:hypothetical protein